MTVLVNVEIPGEPIPKGRPQVRRNGHAYTPARTRNAEIAFAWRLRLASKTPPVSGVEVAVNVVFRTATRRRVDVDNLVKLILDAANGVLWDDDSQVCHLSATIHRGHPQPGTSLIVTVVHSAQLVLEGDLWDCHGSGSTPRCQPTRKSSPC